jgi:dTDP-4-dehydrorhamnose 3,5-epimerase
MKVTPIILKDAFIIENKVFEDSRGFFIESFSAKEIENIIGKFDFVQDNHSMSIKGVLRGLHYQIENVQGKLVRCISGSVFDVIVDLRKSSPTFGKWFGKTLSNNNIQIWVPPGFAHGFYTLSDTAEVQYKVTDYYSPKYDRTLLWCDDQLNISWPKNDNQLIISDKDLRGKSFNECDKYD